MPTPMRAALLIACLLRPAVAAAAEPAAKKKVAKFKAGADLSKSANK